MKYLDEFRDAHTCRALVARIRRQVTRRHTIMEVCGGQTHSLMRYGIVEELADQVDLLHGPGCPVCVTPAEAIDRAIALALRPGIRLASFGDMLRVPGTSESLLSARARGGRVHLNYSPLDAVELARRSPQEQIVFFAVGFETTAPATALAVLQALRLGLDNFSLLAAHVRVQPAMEQLAAADDCRIDAFLAAGHVCTVAGWRSYEEFVARYRLPVVVTGFEPVDLLSGIWECVAQLEHGEARAVNAYPRSAAAQGNPRAMQLVDEVFEAADSVWRGIGPVRLGGLRLRGRWADFDAERRFELADHASETVGMESISALHQSPLPVLSCMSGDVLSGRIRPHQCPAFGTACTPDHPLGAPMVSAEGACAAYHRYAPATDPSAARSETHA